MKLRSSIELTGPVAVSLKKREDLVLEESGIFEKLLLSSLFRDCCGRKIPFAIVGFEKST